MDGVLEFGSVRCHCIKPIHAHKARTTKRRTETPKQAGQSAKITHARNNKNAPGVALPLALQLRAEEFQCLAKTDTEIIAIKINTILY